MSSSFLSQVHYILQHDSKTAESVSNDCQHLIWQYKRNLTKSAAFEAASNRICDSDFKNITECAKVPAGGKCLLMPLSFSWYLSHSSPPFLGQKVACMFEYKDKIKTPECVMFLNKVGTVLFSDFHLIYQFEKKCSSDIMKFNCGRLQSDSKSKEKMDQPSSQVISRLFALVLLSRTNVLF